MSCDCQRAERRDVLRKYSHLPRVNPRPWLDVTRRYVDEYLTIRKSFCNWILFCGQSGCGKTTQAVMIADALLNRYPVRTKFYYYSELVRTLSAYRFDSCEFCSRLDDALSAELVILDDFLDVIPKEESFEEQVALTLVKRRYETRRPLILTTELTPQAFRRLMPRHGEAIFGRIYEMCDGRVSFAENAQNYRFTARKAIIN